jgi:hypothetical protein
MSVVSGQLSVVSCCGRMMECPRFQKLRVYSLAEQVADLLWELIAPWPIFAKDTVAKQLVRAADRIGANIAGGGGPRFVSGESAIRKDCPRIIERDAAFSPPRAPPSPG